MVKWRRFARDRRNRQAQRYGEENDNQKEGCDSGSRGRGEDSRINKVAQLIVASEIEGGEATSNFFLLIYHWRCMWNLAYSGGDASLRKIAHLFALVCAQAT